MSLTYVYAIEHSDRSHYLICGMFYHDPVIKHVSNSYTTASAAACSCCIVLYI